MSEINIRQRKFLSGARRCPRNEARRMKTRPLSLLLLTVGLLSLPALAQVATNALPSGGVVAAGNAAISQAGAAMRVDQASAKAVIDWQSFNIGRGASVSFNQPSASSIALNRVGADGGRSIIDGSLSANGQVWLLNPGGVLFGPTARIDVGGLLAASLKLGNDDFISGNYRFAKDGAASIVNQGTLTAADGGYIALLAPEVLNQGVVSARLGTVTLASGDEMRVDFSGDRLIEIQVDKTAVNGLIENRNLVQAEGGWVLMSTDAAGRLLDGAINNSGIVRATTLAEHAGVIKLLGGTTSVAGTLDASAPSGGDGGFIETSGRTVNVDPSARVTTLAPLGKTGTWLIDPNDYIIAAPVAGGNITGAALSASLGTSNITIQTATQGTPGGNGDIFVVDPVSWSANTLLVLLAQRDVRIDGSIQATGGSSGMAISAVGGITFYAPVNVRGTLDLYSGTGGAMVVQMVPTATLTAGGLSAQGNGNFFLDGAANSLGWVATDVLGGAFNLWSGGNLAVGGTYGFGPTRSGSAGITADNIFLRVDGTLTLNAPVRATGTYVMPHPFPGQRNLLLDTSGTFVNNVGSGGLVSDNFSWLLESPGPASVTLNGLAAPTVMYNCPSGSCSASVPTTGNAILYAGAPVAVSNSTATATTSTETTIAQQSSTTTSATTTTTAAATTPVGGTGSGGATMSNFPAVSSTTTTATTSTQTTQTTTDSTSVAAAEPPPPPKLIVDASKSLPKLAGVLTRSDLQAMGQQMHEARTQLFADALSLLAKDPRAADIADCGADGGEICIAGRPLTAAVQDSYLPVVKRKVALLIGNNAYRSPIPDLETAINDVTDIGAHLREQMGYEVTVVQNADRKGIVDALNGLIRSTERDDSVLVMYAGHGYLQEETKAGYWIPTDASTTSPDKWISNDTIARALGNIQAKQVMLVSDSCYSGSLTKEGKVTQVVGVNREQTLTRRSVMALSSGGEEPVSDEGRDNHSIFAWNMIQSLKQMKDETPGQQLHAAIKDAVTKDFPQVPQYGTIVSAGHAEGGEYLLTPNRQGAR